MEQAAMVGPVVEAVRLFLVPLPPAAQAHLGKEVTAEQAQQITHIMLVAVGVVRGLLVVQGQLTPQMVGLAVLVCNLALLERLHIMLAVAVVRLTTSGVVMLTPLVVLEAAVLARLMERGAREQLTLVAGVVEVQFM